MKKILLVISLISVLLLAGCNKNENIDNVNIPGNTDNQQQEIVDNNSNYTQFSIAVSDETDNKDVYIVGKDNNGIWKEILHENATNIIGTYNNRLYFENEDGIYYIDLAQKPFEKVKFIEYREIEEKQSDYTIISKESVSNFYMVDDNIYFTFNTFAGGTSSTDGIKKINVNNSKSLDDAVHVISGVDFDKWAIDINNKQLYYIEWRTGFLNGVPYNDLAQSLLKYDLETEKQDTIIEGISMPYDQSYIIWQATEAFELYQDKILSIVMNRSTEQNKDGYYPLTYSLHLYDINTMEDMVISTYKHSTRSGGLWSFAEYHNDDIYYVSGDSIIKYNNGNNDIIYTYSTDYGGTEFYGFYFVNDDVIKIVLQGVEDKYLKDGKIYETLPEEAMTNVIMDDGTNSKLILEKRKMRFQI